MKKIARHALFFVAALAAATGACAQSFTGPATITQPTTVDDCVKVGPNGGNNLVDAGAPCGSGGGGSPGGVNHSTQFNNAGSFGGVLGTSNTLLHGNTGANPTFAAVDLAADVTGILPGANGGTGVANTGKTITIGANLATTGGATTLALGATGRTYTFPDVADTVVLLGAAQTLTGKSIAATQLTGALQAAQFPALTGDLTTSAGALATTLATVNSNVGTFGSSTNCVTLTTNGKGLITAISQAACAGGSGTVTTLTSGSGVLFSSGATCTTTCTVSLTTSLRASTGTSDTILAADGGKVYTTSNAAAQAITLPTVGTTGFGSGFGFNPDAIGAGTATITSASNIDGLGSVPLTTGQGASIFSDGTTYHAIMGMPQVAAGGFVGNNGGGTAYPFALTATQATAMLNNATTSLKGLVPAPGTATGKFLKDDLTWATATGGTGCTTTGSALLMGDGAGGCQNVTLGTNLSFAGTTLNAAGGGGSTYTTTFSGNASGTPGAAGLTIAEATATITDNNTAGSGTAALFTGHSIAAPTFAATNATVTTTEADTWYLAGPPTAGTNQTITKAMSAVIATGDMGFKSNASTLRFYNVGGPGVTNREEVDLNWSANVFKISTAANGTGTATRDITLTAGGTLNLNSTGFGLAFQSSGANVMTMNSSGLVGNNANGAQISFAGAASSTNPTLIPNRASSNTGIGSQASGNVSIIAGGAEITRVTGTATTQIAGLTVMKGYTVAGLPTGITGGTAYVTDATVCSFAAAPVGGGSTYCPVTYNGSAWQSF